MEYGLIASLDHFNFNSQKQIQVVNATKEVQALKKEKETNLDYSKNVKGHSDIDSVNSKSLFTNYKEVLLSALNFGYNTESKDFFIKVKRGNAVNQYPTDSMMKEKIYLMSLNRT